MCVCVCVCTSPKSCVCVCGLLYTCESADVIMRVVLCVGVGGLESPRVSDCSRSVDCMR